MEIVSAVQAAVTVATSLGVTCDHPEVLHDSFNLIVHLRPAPVVARVATLTARVRPGTASWFERSALVARHVASRGLLTTTPLVPAVDSNGHVVGLWRHEPHDPGYAPTPVEVATLLFDLHTALSDLTEPLPRHAPCDDIERGLRLLRLPEPVLARLRAENERLRADLDLYPAHPLHGDAHPGNLLATPAGLMWNDFEDTWLGPLGWDLACLMTSRRLDGAAAVAAYPGSVPADELTTCVELRRLSAVVWRFVLADRFPQRRADADEHLARWLAAR
jgi:hypothetical protein